VSDTAKLRIRPDRVAPGIDRASADDRESFLEAAESLERRGLLSLVWVRHRKGENLSTLVCRDPELLYELAGKPSPKTVAEAVRTAARTFAAESGSEAAAFFSFLAETLTPLDATGGIDVTAAEDLARLTRFLFGGSDGNLSRPENWRGKVRGITTRALSVALYGDSKRLEHLLDLFNPLFNRARRQGHRPGITIPDFSLLDRSFPETFIAGKIVFNFEKDLSSSNDAGDPAPLVNATGSILALPLTTVLKLRSITALAEGPAPKALMIENKETFFVLSESLPGYACFLYVGGHPNRAVRALASLLAASGFSLYHAGDLDPDGILILQELAETAGTEVRPLRMDGAVFDRYLHCAKKLDPHIVKRTALINDRTRSIPGIAELIRRVEETGLGVEQEIVDYREGQAGVQG
jgi:hypothetical protein